MRILLLTNVYPTPADAHKGVFNRMLVRALASQHTIRVVAPVSWIDECAARLRRTWGVGHRPTEGVEVHHPRFYYPPKLLRTRYAAFYWWSVRRTVRRLLREDKPDVVFAYWAHPDGAVAVRVARQLGVPAVLMVGGTDVLLLTRDAGRRRRIAEALQAADAVVAVSDGIRAKLLELGVAADRIHVVPRGVDESAFCPGDRSAARTKLGVSTDAPMLLWVGRMVPVKGLDVLLRACDAMRDTAFHLHLVGTGALEGDLKKQATALGLGDRVHFPGPRDPLELPDWYRAADWTVLPSRSEGIPNALRESLACGTPFVASAVGSIHEIARPGVDVLVPPEDPQVLAAALRDALANPPPPSRAALPTWRDSAAALVRIAEAVPAKPRSAPSGWRQLVKRALTRALPRRVFLTHGPADAVALTFDDGPDPVHTPALLDRLKALDVRATFFVVGQNAERHPDLVRRIAADGHAVGNHTYSPHAGGRETRSCSELIAEVERTAAVLTGILGTRAPLFRPPFGHLTARLLWRLWRSGYSTMLWNVDPKDFARASAADVLAWFASRPLCPGDVVLMHDTQPHAAAVMPEVVTAGRARGLRFARLDEWI